MTTSPWDEYSESVTFTQHYSDDGAWYRGVTVDRWPRKTRVSCELYGLALGGRCRGCTVIGSWPNDLRMTIEAMNGQAVYRLIVIPELYHNGIYAAELVSATGPVPDGWEEE